MAGKRILVVDDEEDVRDYVSRVLVGEGYEVETAGDGKEALECLRGNPIELIVSDGSMKPIDGIRLLEVLKDVEGMRDFIAAPHFDGNVDSLPEVERTRDVPVIMMSSSSDYLADALNLGAVNILKKTGPDYLPDRDQLVAAVGEILG